MRSLDRWAAKNLLKADDRPSRSALGGDSNVNCESSHSAEESSDHSSCRRQNSNDHRTDNSFDVQSSHNDSYDNTISDYELQNLEDQEICNECDPKY